MAGDLCVDVVKYSHATGIRPDNSIPWTHLSGSGIFIILKRIDRGGGDDDNLELRVVQGTTALESVHVSDLIDSAIAARQGSQQAGIAPQVEQLPIFGITKDVLLALRYRVDDGQARRIQFRMQSAADCIRVVEILQRRGMEFQQQRPRTARPDTASSNVRPMTTTSSFSNSTCRVPSKTITPSPFQPQTLEAGSLSHQTPARPESLQTVYPNVSSNSSGSMAPPMLPHPDQQHSVSGATNPQPMTALPFESYPFSASDAHSAMHTSTPITSYAVSEASESFFQRPPAIHSFQQPSLPIPHATEPTSHDPAWPSHQSGFGLLPTNDENQSISRPTTARSAMAASFTMPMTLEHEIPPPRKLPFERSGSSRPSTAASVAAVDHAGEQSNTNTLPKKAIPKKAPATARPTTASPLKRSFAALEHEVENERPQTAITPISRRPSPVRPRSGGGPRTGIEDSMRRPSNVGEMMRTMKPLAERSPTAVANKVQRMKSLADADYELETPPRTSSESHRRDNNDDFSSPTRCKGGERDTTLTTYAAIQRTGETSSLAKYAAQSRPDRIAMLDEFMISKLEDAAFTDLAEDVDSCWRRLQLGL